MLARGVALLREKVTCVSDSVDLGPHDYLL